MLKVILEIIWTFNPEVMKRNQSLLDLVEKKLLNVKMLLAHKLF